MKTYQVWTVGMKPAEGECVEALDSFMARQKAAAKFRMSVNQVCARRVNADGSEYDWSN
jgi:hypothetical protein